MEYWDYFATGLALISMFMGLWSQLLKNDGKLKLTLAGMSVASSWHYYLLGEMEGAFVRALSVLRFVLSYFNAFRHLAWAFIVVYLVYGYFYVTEWYGWLPLFGASVVTLGLYYSYGYKMRITGLISTLCWLAYSVIVWSPIMIVYELCTALLAVRMIFLLYRDEAGNPYFARYKRV